VKGIGPRGDGENVTVAGESVQQVRASGGRFHSSVFRCAQPDGALAGVDSSDPAKPSIRAIGLDPLGTRDRAVDVALDIDGDPACIRQRMLVRRLHAQSQQPGHPVDEGGHAGEAKGEPDEAVDHGVESAGGVDAIDARQRGRRRKR